jgi:hypothetical protein
VVVGARFSLVELDVRLIGAVEAGGFEGGIVDLITDLGASELVK